MIMPLKIHQRRIGGTTTTISSIMVSAQDGVSTAKVQSDLENLLRERGASGLAARTISLSTTWRRSPLP